MKTIAMCPTDGGPCFASTEGKLAEGDAGIRATVGAMVAMIRSSKRSMVVPALAARTFTDHEPMSAVQAANLVYELFRESIDFLRDVIGREYVKHPDTLVRELLEWEWTKQNPKPKWDCKKVATLGASILLAAGFQPVLIIIAIEPAGPFVHVYFGVRTGEGENDIYVVDPQEGFTPGTQAEYTRREVFDV